MIANGLHIFFFKFARAENRTQESSNTLSLTDCADTDIATGTHDHLFSRRILRNAGRKAEVVVYPWTLAQVPASKRRGSCLPLNSSAGP